jgi:glutaminyl-peptide cyclotransferase
LAAKLGDASPASKRQAQPVVDGAHAMQYVKEIVAFGPRYIGSPGHAKVEGYLRSHLKGDALEEDAFTVDSPEGKFPARNFIAKFPGKKDGIIIIASHYDTNYPLRNTTFVGANDGGSTSALLLELARHFRGTKLEGYSVWLVWTDAEEAVRQWTSTDSVYGSRHLAETWEKDGTLKHVKAFLLADMLGDADLNVDRDANSTAWLEDLVLEAATRLGDQSHFFARTNGFDDDHTPFSKRGVAVADLLDLDYGYNNVFWHTPQDTVDKLSPRSLEIAGDVIYETVLLIDERK